MAQFWIPGDSDFARALRGWPSSPIEKPLIAAKPAAISDAPDRLFLIAENGGAKTLEHITEQRVNITGTYAWVPQGVYFSSSIGYIESNYEPKTRGAIQLIFTPTTSTGSKYIINQSDAFGSIFRIYWDDRRIYWNTNGAAYSKYMSSDFALSNCVGEQIVLTFFWDGDTGDKKYRIKRGNQRSVEYSITGDTVPWSISGAGDVYLFGRNYSTGELGIAKHVACWDGRWPNIEKIADEPFSYIEPANDAPFLISAPAGGGAPTLSSPGVINVLSDRATPQVTLTF